MLDTPSTSSTTHDHGTHVSSIAAGVIGGTTHGVAPEADAPHIGSFSCIDKILDRYRIAILIQHRLTGSTGKGVS